MSYKGQYFVMTVPTLAVLLAHVSESSVIGNLGFPNTTKVNSNQMFI